VRGNQDGMHEPPEQRGGGDGSENKSDGSLRHLPECDAFGHAL
jgi:hypothetical protein